MKRSSHYDHAKEREQGGEWDGIGHQVQEIYAQNQERYGYRRITIKQKGGGYGINHKAVQRMMRAMGLSGKVRMKKYRFYRDEEGKTAPNLLNREFKAARPNEKWVTDVTELIAYLDYYNNRRIKARLGGPTPAAFRARVLKSA